MCCSEIRCARLSSYLDKLAKERGRHPSANFEELQQAHPELCGASCEIERFCGMLQEQRAGAHHETHWNPARSIPLLLGQSKLSSSS